MPQGAGRHGSELAAIIDNRGRMPLLRRSAGFFSFTALSPTYAEKIVINQINTIEAITGTGPVARRC